jgi:hypothetical protein
LTVRDSLRAGAAFPRLDVWRDPLGFQGPELQARLIPPGYCWPERHPITDVLEAVTI